MKNFQRILVALDHTVFDEKLIRYFNEFNDLITPQKVHFLYVDQDLEIPPGIEVVYSDEAGNPLSKDEILNNALKRKVDAGADKVITQFFFDSDAFLRFIDKCRNRGINVPIIPGILPVSNVKQMIHFSKMCGTTIPKWMIDVFRGLDERVETRKVMAGVVAIELCRILHREGISDFHFYTLNRSDLVTAICHILGVRDPIVG